MARILIVAAVPLIVGSWLLAQQGTSAMSEGRSMHRVVFEMTAEGTEQWQAVLNNVENVRKALGPENTQVEVVVHAKAIDMLVAKTDTPGVQERVRSLAGPQVVFAACSNTMKKRKLAREDLLPEAVIVDSGVAEVVRKQEQGWSYIKGGY
jgi:intracellular sulfur oxidation DsrE/DsrF family protein